MPAATSPVRQESAKMTASSANGEIITVHTIARHRRIAGFMAA